MPVTVLDPITALIVVDLQKGIAAMPGAHPIAGVVERSAALAKAFRDRKLPVVLVNVDAVAPGRTQQGARLTAFPPEFAELLPELNRQPGDHLVTKRTWGAFTGADLEAYLRGKGVTQVVVTGVATSAGVESTARFAHELGFNVTLATDAMTDMSAEAHENSVTRIFPRMAETGTSAAILALLGKADARGLVGSVSKVTPPSLLLTDQCLDGSLRGSIRQTGRVDARAHIPSIVRNLPMAADGNITKDLIYDAVAPDDFESMLELDRYNARSTAFDKIISATHDHFWDPLDKKYIDFDEPFDMENTMILPEKMIGALQLDYVNEILGSEKERIRFANAQTLRTFSSILHGEQGALNLSASLCHVLKDQGAQEYAANQTREEARHVTAFAKYIKARWGRPVECGPILKDLLVEIIGAPEVYKKIIGMQMLVEGLAMGAFATVFNETNDPLAKKLTQLVMTDEAFHHKFGKIWADRTIPHLSEAEHEVIEMWAAHCFQTLLFNLVAPTQNISLYEEFGLDPDRVIEEMGKLVNDETRREEMKEATNIFRVLVKTLVNAGIITDRTKGFYSMYVDIDELKSEGDKMVGDDIAEEGIKYLQEINFKDRALSKILIAAE